MGERTELKVPMRPVAVELALVGHEPGSAELFVPDVPRSGHSQLVQDVAEMLDEGDPFLPVRVGRHVTLCNKAAVEWVAVPPGSAGAGSRGDAIPHEVESEPSEVLTLYDQKHDLRVEVVGGLTVDGHVLYTSPSGQQRVIDHLNRVGRFLWVWQGQTLYLVNRQHIVRVLELDR